MQPVTTLFLSAVTIGEIRRGLVVLPQGRRRADLGTWFHTELLVWFGNRVADRWGMPDGQCQLRGTPLNTAEGMIAATAIEHDPVSGRIVLRLNKPKPKPGE